MKLTNKSCVKLLSLIESCSTNSDILTDIAPDLHFEITEIDENFPYSDIFKSYNDECIAFRLNDNFNVGLAQTIFSFDFSTKVEKNGLSHKTDKQIKDRIMSYLEENFEGLYDIRYSSTTVYITFNYMYIESLTTVQIEHKLLTKTDYDRSYNFCVNNYKDLNNHIDYFFDKLI